jgi:hypothetical protein
MLSAQTLTGWTELLIRTRGWPTRTITGLTADELLEEIARLQFGLVLDAARGAYHAGEGRDAELRRLSAAPSPIDRHAAALARRWIAADRQRR